MPCFYPLNAWRSDKRNKQTFKRSLVFDRKTAAPNAAPLKVSCGQCRGCRRAKTREWATRLICESQMHQKNCFLTLTYNNENMPENGSLQKPYSKKGDKQSDFQLFMKNLRKKYGNGIRYYMCGEYGENFARPHHHAILFNHDFHDKYKISEGEYPLYRSESLEKLWPHGYSTIGSADYESACYVAGYVQKKINGQMAPGHYQGRYPEYSAMSRRPGIGTTWLEKYKTDVYPKDKVILYGGKIQKVPKIFNQKYELTNPEEYANIRLTRVNTKRDDYEYSPMRLHQKQMCEDAKFEQNSRNYEKG